VQREDLNPLEAAEAFRQLSEDFHLTHEDIAARVGKSRAAVTNTLRLLGLPEKVKQALLEEVISEGHARVLLALPTPQAQVAALDTVMKQALSVRQTEELVKKLLGERPPRPLKPGLPAEVEDLQNRLESSLGFKVNLRHGKRGGSITIHYYNQEDLNTLADRLLGE
jgi:ParB family chromosome partitioning protein